MGAEGRPVEIRAELAHEVVRELGRISTTCVCRTGVHGLRQRPRPAPGLFLPMRGTVVAAVCGDVAVGIGNVLPLFGGGVGEPFPERGRVDFPVAARLVRFGCLTHRRITAARTRCT